MGGFFSSNKRKENKLLGFVQTKARSFLLGRAASIPPSVEQVPSPTKRVGQVKTTQGVPGRKSVLTPSQKRAKSGANNSAIYRVEDETGKARRGEPWPYCQEGARQRPPGSICDTQVKRDQAGGRNAQAGSSQNPGSLTGQHGPF